MSPPQAILLTFAMVLRGETDIAGVDLLAAAADIHMY